MIIIAIILMTVSLLILLTVFLYKYARWARRIAFATCESEKKSQEFSDKTQFKILSLNVQMIDWYTTIPTRFFSRLFPNKRCKQIIDFLKQSNHDVVLLQEAFNVGFQDRMIEGLKEIFPFSLAYRPKTPFFRWINNGLMIFSKYPLKETQLIEFEQLTGPSWWMPMGAVLARVDAPRPFHVLNTHMQALEGFVNDKYRIHGATLLKYFIEQNTDETLPLVMGGDFNTSRRHGYFRALLRLFNVKLYQWEGEQKWSWDPGKNPLCNTEQGNYPETLDWIFVRDAANKVRHKAARILPVHLSDHFPVEREIVIE